MRETPRKKNFDQFWERQVETVKRKKTSISKALQDEGNSYRPKINERSKVLFFLLPFVLLVLRQESDSPSPSFSPLFALLGGVLLHPQFMLHAGNGAPPECEAVPGVVPGTGGIVNHAPPARQAPCVGPQRRQRQVHLPAPSKRQQSPVVAVAVVVVVVAVVFLRPRNLNARPLSLHSCR